MQKEKKMFLFPPALDAGSRDVGMRGAVRCMQTVLVSLRPRFAEIINHKIDGHYGPMTRVLVAFFQEEAIQNRMRSEEFAVDGNLGPITRLYFLERWGINFNQIPWTEDGGCFYASDGVMKQWFGVPIEEEGQGAHGLVDASENTPEVSVGAGCGTD
jgi:hypothetical protein